MNLEPPKSEAGQQPSDRTTQVHGVITVHHDLNMLGCKTFQSNHAEHISSEVITINYKSPAVLTNIACFLVTGDI